MFESIVSMGLLAKALIADDVERYEEFQYVEIYKTYSHLKKLGFQDFSGVVPSEVDLMSNKRADYIKKWGRSTLSWTGKSLEESVRLVDEAYPATCNENHFYEYLYCQVYRKGSQSVHSSFAGLSKGVDAETVPIPGVITARRYRVNESHLIFSCFNSLLVFLSSVRFLGHITGKKDSEGYFQKVARHIISED